MIPEWLSFVDLAFLGVALLFGLGGVQRGFASQVSHIITFVALGVFLMFAYPAIFNLFARLFRNLSDLTMAWLLLAGVVVLAVLFFMLVNKALATVIKTQISDRTDRWFGFVLGTVRGALVALFVMVFIAILGSEKFYTVFSEKSRVGRLVCYEMVPRIQPHLNKSNMGDGFDRMREALIQQDEAGVYDE